VLTGAQVEGSTIPEVMPVEGVVSEAEVITGAAIEPAETTTPGVTEEVRNDALPETNHSTTTRFSSSLMCHDGQRRTRGYPNDPHCNFYFISPFALPPSSIKGRGGQPSQGLTN
jgi:hypothetical protein